MPAGINRTAVDMSTASSAAAHAANTAMPESKTATIIINTRSMNFIKNTMASVLGPTPKRGTSVSYLSIVVRRRPSPTGHHNPTPIVEEELRLRSPRALTRAYTPQRSVNMSWLSRDISQPDAPHDFMAGRQIRLDACRLYFCIRF